MDAKALMALLSDLGIENLRFNSRGDEIIGCCPVHRERRPSWGVSVGKDRHPWNCFSCGSHGFLSALLVSKYGWTMGRAEEACGGTPFRGGALPPDPFAEEEREPEPDRRLLLAFTDPPPRTVKWLRSRMLKRRSAAKAWLKFSPQDRTLVFPWRFDGAFIGATGRRLDEREIARYGKSVVYFGLRKSRWLYVPAGKLEPMRPVALVEGEMDALRLWQENRRVQAAAVCGGNLSRTQIEIVKRLCPSVVYLAFDADETGRRLTAKAERAFRDSVPVRRFEYPADALEDAARRNTKADPAELSDSWLRELDRRCTSGVDWFANPMEQ